MLRDGSDYTPYEGVEITGWPITTLVRGRVIVRDGSLEAPEAGVCLPRDISVYA